MPASARRPSKRWLSSSSLRFHLPMIVGAPGCFAAGWFELTRALGGREIAWVYAVEWPLYGIVGLYMWWRLWHAEMRGVADRRPAPDVEAPSSEPQGRRPGRADKSRSSVAAARRTVAPDDPGLTAWQDYLANLQAIDPPGEPPSKA